MDDYTTALTAALERAYGGSAHVHPDDDGGLTVYVSGADGTIGFTTGPGHSAIAEVLGIRLPIDPGQ
ncbi:MAG TPA: hypothetical protein VHZ03_29985 [Trebonia sp.]|jgi:hypothetical protein|nr:hypothetical protein [Trebonia sp.]